MHQVDFIAKGFIQKFGLVKLMKGTPNCLSALDLSLFRRVRQLHVDYHGIASLRWESKGTLYPLPFQMVVAAPQPRTGDLYWPEGVFRCGSGFLSVLYSVSLFAVPTARLGTTVRTISFSVYACKARFSRIENQIPALCCLSSPISRRELAPGSSCRPQGKGGPRAALC